MKYLVDTCGWIEWFVGGEFANHFGEYLKQPSRLIIPTIVQFELFRWLSREKDEASALDVIGLTEQSQIVPLDTSLALYAAQIAEEKKLAMADAIIYSTANQYQALLVTADKHFSHLADVDYIDKRKK